jgi:hypothetical protein
VSDARSIVRAILFEGLEFSNNKLFTPPHEVIQYAKQKSSLKDSQGSFDKNKGSGKRKISDLSNGTPQTFDQMNRLLSFFRTEEASGNVGSIEWELHGGTPAYDWVKREVGGHRDHNLASKSRMRMAGGANKNKGMGVFDKKIMDPTNTRDKSRVA